MKVAQLLGLWGPWAAPNVQGQTASAAGVMALSESFFEPLVAGDQKASLASLSLYLFPFSHLQGSLAWSPSLAQHIRHIEGPHWLGSYSVVQCIRL